MLSFPSFAAEDIIIEGVRIDKGIREKYEYLANYFAHSLIPNYDENGMTEFGMVETSTPVFCYDIFGVQIGFFTNGFIITFLAGENAGRQVVVFHEKIIGISYASPSAKNKNIHIYAWGKVFTRYDCVEVQISHLHEYLELL